MRYMLIRTHETASIGGYDVNRGILASSTLQSEIADKLKNIVEIAANDKRVEFINGIERDEFDLPIDFFNFLFGGFGVGNDVVVEYYAEGMTIFNRATYSIMIEDGEI